MKLSHNDYSRKMALFALQTISELDPKTLKNVDTLAKRLPSMIQTNGLAPSIAFLMSKSASQNEFEKTIDAFQTWLTTHSIYKDVVKKNQDQDLMEALCKLETPYYRIITNEAIQFFDWMRRFTSAKTG